MLHPRLPTSPNRQRSRVMVKMLHATLLSFIITGIASVGAQGPAFISSTGSSKCLTVRGSQFIDGTPVEMLVCLIAREFLMMTLATDGILIL